MKSIRRLPLCLMLVIVLLVSVTACRGSGEPTMPPLFGTKTDRTEASVNTPKPAEQPSDEVSQVHATEGEPEPTITETAAPTEPEPTLKTAPDDVQGEVNWSNNLMVLNGRVMEMFYGNEAGITDYTARLNRFAAKLPADVRVVSMVSPTSGEFYTPAQYHSAVNSQMDAIQSIYDQLDDRYVTADSYHTLLQHTDEYIYFRTDHHWTGLGAYYGYHALMTAMGIEPKPLDEYTEYELSGTYLGSLYRWVQGNASVTNNPDHVFMYRPDDYSATAHVFTDFSLQGGYGMHLLATQFEGNEKYLSFSGGDAPLLQISSDAGTGKKVVVIKDSYANALVPHLANHYDESYIIDPRAISGNLIEFIKTVEADDVIVMNYAFAYSNPTWNEKFEALFSGF